MTVLKRSPLIWVTLLLSIAQGCSNAVELLVTLNTPPARAQSVVASILLDKKSLTFGPLDSISGVLDLPPGQNKVGFRLPAEGSVKLNLQILDSDQCTQATAAPEPFVVVTGINKQDVPLTPISPRKCGNLPVCASGSNCSIPATGQTWDIERIWATAPNDIWAVGNSSTTVLHYNGSNWSPMPLPTNLVSSGYNLNGVWASASDDVWAVGSYGTIIRYDGKNWSKITVPVVSDNSLQKIHGIGAHDMWVVGNPPSTSPQSKPPFLHGDGTNWTQIQQDIKVTGNLTSVYEVDKAFIVAAGGDSTAGSGSLVVYDGNTVTDYSKSVSKSRLFDVWGFDREHVFAVGAAGAIYRFDGSNWSSISTGITLTNLNGVTGDNNSVYVASDTGQVAHSIGPAFTQFFIDAGNKPNFGLFTLHLASNGIVWVGGQAGFIGYLDSRP